MAWPEKTASGIYRLREAGRINGKKRTIDLIKDLGADSKFADQACSDYEKAKTLGYVWNPESQHVLADIEHFLKAKKLGIDPTEPARDIKDATLKWLTASKLDSSTRKKYQGSVEAYCAHSRARLIDDMTVDSINAWREAMEKGVLTYSRGGKLPDGTERQHQYTDTSIGIMLKDLRIFCNYCVLRGWMSGDPANKAKPLNPFLQIKITEPKAVRRYLTRPEAARLLRACRLNKFVAGGNKPVPHEVRGAVIEMALKKPELGKWKVKRALDKKGIRVPLGTIDWLWRRNDLVNERDRRRAAARPGPFIPATTLIDNARATSKIRRRLHFELYTGLREGETRRARCEDIVTHDVLDPRSLVPRRVYGLNVLRPSKGGDEKIRIIWFPPNAARIHGIAKKVGKTGPLLDPIGKSGLAKARGLAVRRAGLGRVRSHDLRHSFARNFLLSETGSLAQLQKELGHSRLSTTGIYSNFANTDLAQAAKNYKVK